MAACAGRGVVAPGPGRGADGPGRAAGDARDVRHCGGARGFRQHRPMRVHTVVPGRDVETTLVYGQCAQCQAGVWPLLQELGTDAEGFTPALQQMATLAGVIEPYEAASTELLGRLAGVAVSREKIQPLARPPRRRRRSSR